MKATKLGITPVLKAQSRKCVYFYACFGSARAFCSHMHELLLTLIAISSPLTCYIVNPIMCYMFMLIYTALGVQFAYGMLISIGVVALL